MTVIGNRFEGGADQAAVSLTGGQGIVEDNRRDEKK